MTRVERSWLGCVAGIAAWLAVTPVPADAADAADERDRAGVEREVAESGPALVALVPLGVTVPATLVARDNDVPPGEVFPVSSLNAPFTNSLGQVGFTGGLDTGGGTDNFVWFDAGVAWHNSDEMVSVLTGAESTMGISDTGGFIYSPAVDGNDAVWTHNGALLVEGDPAPGFAPPALSVFNSRPHMVATGQVYWVGGVSLSGGNTTEARALFTSPDATAGNIQVVLRSGDSVGGFVIDSPSGIDFDFDFSSDGSHHIQALLMETGSTVNDGFVYVDGSLVARESTPSGDGDNWDNFDSMAINASGHYLFSGDTDGATTSDEFIAYDGVISIREGDTIGGFTLTSTATVNALSLDDDGRAVHLWNTSGGIEYLFFACDASSLVRSTLVLGTGMQVDLDDNGTPDATVVDFNASNVVGPGLDLAGDGRVFVEVDLDDGGGAEEAVIALELPLCMPFLDGFKTGDTSRWSSTVP
ncbi:MAG TPA: hypothetical protein VLA66_14580 [Thermoanaerobaculia bacterium]|nr:hypothetical protein [Thermoanaerobaculia bacterium]